MYDEVVDLFEVSKWWKVMEDEMIVLNDNDMYVWFSDIIGK